MIVIKEAFKKSLPVMAGYIVLGTGFGLLLRVNGYGLLWALVMSIFVYAGSLQYVGVSLLASGAGFLSVAITSAMINARHLFYGITMIGPYKNAGWKKAYLIHGLTDETYSLVCTKELPEALDAKNKKVAHWYYFILSLMNQCYWITGSIIGSLIGSLFKFDSAGIEFSMTALFVTVFVDQWIDSKDHRPAITGVIISILCLLVFGRDNFIIPTMIGIMIMLTFMRKSIESSNEINV